VQAIGRDCSRTAIGLCAPSHGESVVSRLADTIRHKLDTGALPTRDPVQVRLGYGRGETCSACGHPVPSSEPEYDFDASKGRTVRLHVECYRLWESERRRAGTRPRAESG